MVPADPDPVDCPDRDVGPYAILSARFVVDSELDDRLWTTVDWLRSPPASVGELARDPSPAAVTDRSASEAGVDVDDLDPGQSGL